MRRTARPLISVAVVLVLAATSRAAPLFDPALRFQTRTTEHFVIYFHQSEGAGAQRLASIAEDTWRRLAERFATAPPPLTHVVLASQTELANGSAFPLPRNTIVITATWPGGYESIGKSDDWLRLVFTHEFTHIMHLDRSEGWARMLRHVLGRHVATFPNLFLPTWQIEGLATYEESLVTSEGRLHSGDFRAIVSEAARAGTLEPVDRVNGGLTDWPAGLGPYAYGLEFSNYLSERFGADALARLSDATAGRVPFTNGPVYTRLFGESLPALWRDFETAATAAARPVPADQAEATRHTRHGFSSLGPRFDRAACAGCPQEILYSARTPNGFPTLNRVTRDSKAPSVLTRRYLGTTTAPGPDAIYFDQLEVSRAAGLYGDLYALDRRSRKVRRLTRGERLLEPDVSPDGRSIVAVRQAADRRELVRVELAPTGVSRIDALVSDPETHFNAPRWSPDGRTIAVERHRLGAQSEVVLVDVGSGRVRVLASARFTRFVTPAWRPDGLAVVLAADPDGGVFNLFEVSLENPPLVRQLTQSTGGALWPDVSADAQRLAYAGYTTGGFEIFETPYAPGARSVSLIGPAGREPSAPAVAPAPTPSETAGYIPVRTLAPTSWAPLVEGDSRQVRIGAATQGADLLGYHVYAASATWLASTPEGAERPSDAAPDWDVSYAYARWVPTLWTSASSHTSFFAGPATAAGTPSPATLRERDVQVGVLLPIRRVRVSQTALASFVRATGDYTFSARATTTIRAGLRAGWTVTSAHTYGYSISPEEGVSAGLTAEAVRSAFGSSADATSLTADARAYLPALAPHHVLAVRVAGGTSTGAALARRTFRLGGAAPNIGLLEFGSGGISLLRGFPSDTFAGTRVVLTNVDYRWPIARPQRGPGSWPVFLHTVHAALVADAGHAWSQTFRARDLKISAGAELSLDLVAGYSVPLTITTGAAWGHDGSGAAPGGSTFYLRVGRAF